MLREYIKNKYTNLSLYKKIVFLVLLTVIFNIIGIFSSIIVLQYYNNKLLYESISTTIATGADVIKGKLNEIEKMTNVIISDNRFQYNLSVNIESNDNELKNEAFQTLTFLVPEYYQNYKNNKINFIDIYTENYTIHSNIVLSNKIDKISIDNCINTAHKMNGSPKWITEYSNEYGLFLVRDIRKAENLSLNRLGTILVNIDIEDLINESIGTNMLSDPASFILMQNEDIVYYSKSLNNDFVSNINNNINYTNYGVMKHNGEKYFYVTNDLSGMNLKLICLLPYDRLFLIKNISIILIIAINILCILIVFLVARKYVNIISVHFIRLEEKMSSFAKNHIYSPDEKYNYIDSNDEIGQLHRIFDDMAIKHQVLVNEVYEKEILTRDAKIKALENQINPHFLYNTLAVINGIAKSNEVSLIIESLSALLRTTLNIENHKVTSSIKKELYIVENYIKIMEIRFRDKLDIRINIPSDFNSIMIPYITLQPLVENAIYYAMDDISSDSYIFINAYEEKNDLYIEIINSGSQFEDDLIEKLNTNEVVAKGNGIGILNIHKRAQLIFGTNYGLSFYNLDDEHAVVVVKVPVRSDYS